MGNKTPMLDSELNELTHHIGREFEKYVGRTLTIDELYRVNDVLEALAKDLGIQIEKDGPR